MTYNNETTIPFQGYYESFYNDLLENQTDLQDENGDELPYEEWPNNINWQAMKEEINKIYVEEFQEYFNELTELNINLKYKLMESPREYNFSTDRLFSEITKEDLQKVFDLATSAQGNFSELLQDKFTSYDGFISYYSNNYQEWINKPLEEYDHNEKGALIEGCIISEMTLQEFEYEIFEKVQERVLCNGEVNLILFN